MFLASGTSTQKLTRRHMNEETFCEENCFGCHFPSLCDNEMFLYCLCYDPVFNPSLQFFYSHLIMSSFTQLLGALQHFSVALFAHIFKYTLSVYTADFYMSNTIQQELNIFLFEQYLTFECYINVEGSEDENQIYQNKFELNHRSPVVH